VVEIPLLTIFRVISALDKWVAALAARTLPEGLTSADVSPSDVGHLLTLWAAAYYDARPDPVGFAREELHDEGLHFWLGDEQYYHLDATPLAHGSQPFRYQLHVC
jgi:hypothetical protein